MTARPSAIFLRKIILAVPLLELGSSQPGDFFELAAQMRDATIMHFMCDFRHRHPFIKKVFLYPLDLVTDIELLDRDMLDLREKVGHIGIIMAKFFDQMGGQVINQWLLTMIDHLHDDVLYPSYQDIPFIFEYFDPCLLQYQAKLPILQRCKFLRCSYFARLNGNGMKPELFQLAPDEPQVSKTNRIFYKEFQSISCFSYAPAVDNKLHNFWLIGVGDQLPVF
jgi:hypothetical protein